MFWYCNQHDNFHDGFNPSWFDTLDIKNLIGGFTQRQSAFGW